MINSRTSSLNRIKTVAVYLLFICINFTFILKIVGGNTTIGIVLICLLPLITLNYRYQTLSIILLFLFLLIILQFNTYGVLNIIFFLLVAYSLRGMRMDTILKANLLSQILMFLICILLLKIGLIEDKAIPKGIGEAHDFGYENPNTFALYYIYLLITLFLLYYKHTRNIILFIVIASPIIYKFTLSRSVILVSLLIIIFYIIPSKFSLRLLSNRVFVILTLCMIPLFTIIILSDSLFNSFNSISSYRLYYMLEMINEFSAINLIYGISIPEELIIDNVYMLLTMFGGLISLLFILYRYYYIMTHQLYPIRFLIVLYIIFIFGFIESCYLNPFISGTYIIWVLFIGNKSIIKLNEDHSNIYNLQPGYK